VTSRGLERYAPLAGVVFFVLFVLLFILGGDEPDANDGTGKVVAYWTNHDGKEMTLSVLAAFAAIFLVWFASSLRSVLLRAEGGQGRLATVSFAGGVIAAVGITLFGGLAFTAADTAGEVPPAVTQTLSVMNADMFIPAVVGFFLFLFAAGLAILRTGALPAWLGWASIVIAILSITPAGFVGFLAAIVWVGLVGILLYLAEAAAPLARPVD
jgi:hypothetical protein